MPPDTSPADAEPADVVAVLGGTGALGRGLARRFAAAGRRVVVGSRDADRAVTVAAEVASATDAEVTGATNAEAARAAEVVVVAVPWRAHAPLLADLADDLAGRVVVDCTNPLGFDAGGAYALDVPEGSATQQAASLLPGCRVVGAFHHVPAGALDDPAVSSFDLDVLVLGDDDDACEQAAALVGCLPGARAVRAGRLRDAGPVEALTANLIAINRHHGGHASLRVTGLAP